MKHLTSLIPVRRSFSATEDPLAMYSCLIHDIFLLEGARADTAYRFMYRQCSEADIAGLFTPAEMRAFKALRLYLFRVSKGSTFDAFFHADLNTGACMVISHYIVR